MLPETAQHIPLGMIRPQTRAASTCLQSPRCTCTIIFLEIVTARQDFFASGMQVQCVLKLRHIRATSVTQRRIGIDDAHIAQIL